MDNDYTVSAAKFSPDGRLVALASFDNKVTILDASTKRVLTRLKGHFGQIGSQILAFSPDGRLLATADKGAVNLWRTSDWQLSHRLAERCLSLMCPHWHSLPMARLWQFPSTGS